MVIDGGSTQCSVIRIDDHSVMAACAFTIGLSGLPVRFCAVVFVFVQDVLKGFGFVPAFQSQLRQVARESIRQCLTLSHNR
jgi:hypothetical protein